MQWLQISMEAIQGYCEMIELSCLYQLNGVQQAVTGLHALIFKHLDQVPKKTVQALQVADQLCCFFGCVLEFSVLPACIDDLHANLSDSNDARNRFQGHLVA